MRWASPRCRHAETTLWLPRLLLPRQPSRCASVNGAAAGSLHLAWQRRSATHTAHLRAKLREVSIASGRGFQVCCCFQGTFVLLVHLQAELS